MYKNLNDYTSTTLDVKFNNTNQLSDVGKQVNSVITFTKNDVQLDVVSNQKQLVIPRIIKHCLIKCPDGQIWNTLDYKFHYKQSDQDTDTTTFDFSYINDDEWQDGQYFIYVGASDVKNTFSNSPQPHGVSLLRNVSQHYYLKKLVAGNGTKLYQDKDTIIIETSQNNYTSQPMQFGSEVIIDLKNGNLQLAYTIEDSVIVDLVNSTYDYLFEEQTSSSSQLQQNSDSSQSSQNSYTTQDDQIQHQVSNVSIILYKPNQTTLKYKNLQILQRYDIGWFAFTIRKIFGRLFISQPTRIITDFEV